DLAKGKLTLPILLLRDLAEDSDRLRLEDVIRDWQPGSLTLVSELLCKYDTLTPSVGVVQEYLKKARQSLQTLPASSGRSGLLSVTHYLSRQTNALADG